jgi:hypothetical protein
VCYHKMVGLGLGLGLDLLGPGLSRDCAAMGIELGFRVRRLS